MNIRSKFLNRYVLLIIASFLGAHMTNAVELANGHKSDYRIVIASNAIPSEHYAAEELQHYLEKITGAKLPIVLDSEKPSAKEILLGNNSHLRKLGLAPNFARLGPDGFLLRAEGKRLIIAGGQTRGTLNGVYSLLEDKMGVRWFTPDVESIPQTNRLVLPNLNETIIPALEYREVYWSEPVGNATFAARHHLNGANYALMAREGGNFAVYFPFVHSMDQLVPPELYKEHPEYFPLIDGKRVNGYVQRCLSNPEVIKLAKATVRQWINEHPEANIISVSQNDTINFCQCDACKALDDREGSPSASMIQFVNAVAEDIEHDYPNVRIDTLAYQYSRRPPKTLRPRSNVDVRLCSIECCFSHPLEICVSERNHKFCDDIIAWQPVATNLYIWDYTTDFGHYQQPFPNFTVLQPNVQFFVKHGVKGLFEQGNYSGGGHGEMEPLRAYLLSELLWNPDADVPKLINEFLQGYYGHAAPQMHAYLDLLEQQVHGEKVHSSIGDPPTASYLNKGFIKAADKILSDAEAAAENDAVKLRVRIARLPIWYVQLATDRVIGLARTALLNQFAEVGRKAGISEIAEASSFEDWVTKMRSK